jgi:hypothetical protein
MNKIIIGMVFTTALFAFDAEVKKAPVSLLINEKSKDLKVGEKFTLIAGDMICFTKGDGRVVIVGKIYKKQLSKRNKSCKYLPSENGQKIEYSDMLKNSVVSIFEKSKEKSTDGVSRKSIENDTLTVPISMGSNANYLAVENSTWGPLPITLELLDTKGKILETMINKEDIITSFILPRNILQDGYSIKVSNTFGDLLVNSKIHF